jgi:Xaa-Pro aminopeptidase
MSEAELGAEVARVLLREGHHAVTRLSRFDTELFMVQVCFGGSSLRPNAFDGPGGIEGLSAAVPQFGSHHRRLRRGELVFVDCGCGVDGYHTDKTTTYAFGDLPEHAHLAHRRCVDIQAAIAARLRPGTAPSAIYEEIMADLDPAFREGFMGLGEQQVRFLGHGVGLQIDEYPAIARGFDEPLEASMTLAVEPKKGIPGVGLVGIENTFVVTPDGGCSLTGTSPGMIAV